MKYKYGVECMYIFKMVLGIGISIYLMYTLLRERHYLSALIAGMLFVSGILAITTSILNDISFFFQLIVAISLGLGFVLAYTYELAKEDRE